jgi:hypothetical protein
MTNLANITEGRKRRRVSMNEPRFNIISFNITLSTPWLLRWGEGQPCGRGGQRHHQLGPVQDGQSVHRFLSGRPGRWDSLAR